MIAGHLAFNARGSVRITYTEIWSQSIRLEHLTSQIGSIGPRYTPQEVIEYARAIERERRLVECTVSDFASYKHISFP